MTLGTPTVEYIADQLELLANDLQTINNGPGRCRELSLAYTALQEAEHWLIRFGMVNNILKIIVKFDDL